MMRCFKKRVSPGLKDGIINSEEMADILPIQGEISPKICAIIKNSHEEEI
jgi:hypothetical protein